MHKKANRNIEIVRRFVRGASASELAREYEISAERVRQLYYLVMDKTLAAMDPRDRPLTVAVVYMKKNRDIFARMIDQHGQS